MRKLRSRLFPVVYVTAGVAALAAWFARRDGPDLLTNGPTPPVARPTPAGRPAGLGELLGRQADPGTRRMPLCWEDIHREIIPHPDATALERGEILVAQQVDGDQVIAQTVGLIEAMPERSFEVGTDYPRFDRIMSFTERSQVVREFRLDGPVSTGARAVDLWTRVNLLGLKTGYLLRIAHLEDRPAHRFRTFWTLVRTPGHDAGGERFINDVAGNIGTHVFEPYRGDPRRTLHTYILALKAKDMKQEYLVRLFGGGSMREVTKSLRRAVAGDQVGAN